MGHLRLTVRSLARTTALLCGLVVFAAACSGGDDNAEEIIAATIEASSEAAENAAAAAEAATQAASDAGTEAAIEAGTQTDQDRYQQLIANSDRFAQTAVGGAGRLVLGVDCLEGFPSPTAIVTILGSDLPPGQHQGTATPDGRATFFVQAEQVQDLPAGSSFYAAQRGFDAAEYVYTFDSLDGVTLTVTGC